MGCQLWHYDPSGPASVDLAEWELGRFGDPENIHVNSVLVNEVRKFFVFV